ncbi:hypothetical protein [Falsibacillus albus]|uniref:DUF2178 domain-containing protein n=1 Tax=Falsibacillus albus TaxID=2478915 RepID=A0A3L7JVG1_9BACI|nr:hypothetical protein [Falsibacillus albus]RLQ94847.1 hypothetical protein D9X91_12725 [Falsibacillus albus]
MNKRISFLGLGSFFTLLAGIMMIALIMDSTNHGFNYNLLIMIALAVLSFSCAAVLPHMQDQDERSAFIKQKAVKVTFITLCIVVAVILILASTSIISLGAVPIIQVIISISIIVSSISAIVIAKNN